MTTHAPTHNKPFSTATVAGTAPCCLTIDSTSRAVLRYNTESSKQFKIRPTQVVASNLLLTKNYSKDKILEYNYF